jgi:hypothetical protein
VAFRFGETTTAKDHLASLWLQAESTQRRAITITAHRIEQILTRSADSVGTPHPFGQLPAARRLDVPPLSAIFAFLPSVGQVSVIDYLLAGDP